MSNPKAGRDDTGPTPLNPFESTPSSTIEGQIALEVLPQMSRATSVHAPVRDESRKGAVLWVLAGMLAVGLLALGIYVVVR
jgi:hypothetical protein